MLFVFKLIITGGAAHSSSQHIRYHHRSHTGLSSNCRPVFPCVGETISVPGVVWSCCISNESWRCEVLQRHHQHLISFSQARVVSSPSSTDREHFLLWRFSDGRQTVWTYHSEIVLTEFCRINSRNVGSVTRQAWPAGCHVTLFWAKHFYYNGWGELATSQSPVMS